MPRRKTTGTTDGVLLVDKPVGVSSHDAVSAARRALHESRIGHGGTLDPFATGLLVLLVGRATRLLPHLSGEPKIYEATIRFGTETDTEDHLGTVAVEAPLPTREALLAALPTFVGAIAQVPPAFSAKRVDGERAYAMARRGVTVDLAPVTIQVHRWEVLALRPAADGRVAEAEVRITCGGGTYIRSLARDLARAVGSAAHLTALRRTRSGPFRVEDAVTLESLRAATTPSEGPAASRSELSEMLLPPLAALPAHPVQPLAAEEIAQVVRGIEIPAAVEGGWGALTNAASGALVALAERRGDRWQPRVVMHEA
ncbi:MAG: tRNA pseudouridine(55) synthase TruB [Gemmatimonadota bacterium]|nr:tRNA pseudouridine(55) synthase TruB [Gemmatimonadota bacterium]